MGKKLKMTIDKLIDEINDAIYVRDFRDCIHKMCILYENGIINHITVDQISDYIIEKCIQRCHIERAKRLGQSVIKNKYDLDRQVENMKTREQFMRIILDTSILFLSNIINGNEYDIYIHEIVCKYTCRQIRILCGEL